MNRTQVEYLDYTWNPTHGCTYVSDGCKYCRARTMARNLAGAAVSGYDPHSPFSVVVDPTRTNEPLKRIAPARIGVCFMGDLFHRYVPDVSIGDIFDIMASAERHTFVLPTKRPERWVDWIYWMGDTWPGDTHFSVNMEVLQSPGKNIWMGVTAETLDLAKKRVHHLSKIPAEVKFLSLEPLLEKIKLTPGIMNYVDWVICGPGHQAPPFSFDWVRSIRDQCQDAGIKFFMRDLGRGNPLPNDLNIKQIPDERN